MATKFKSLFVVTLVLMIIFCELVDSQTQERTRGSRRRSRHRSRSHRRYRLKNRLTTPTPDEVTETESTEVTTQPSTTSTPEPVPSSTQANNLDENPVPYLQESPIEGCGVCDPKSCHTTAESSCSTGMVKDKCSCCFICGAGVGNRCYNESLNLPDSANLGVCGPGLACILRTDLEPSEDLEALCECKDKRIVCGSDNKSYKSECKFREVAFSRPDLEIKSWEPCITAPWIPNAIENVTASVGEDISMSCEVHGSPPPVIHWEFAAGQMNGVSQTLPGDDSSVVIVVRGGPEEIMTTSWIQIISVDEKRVGTYICVAENAQGKTQSAAWLNLR